MKRLALVSFSLLFLVACSHTEKPRSVLPVLQFDQTPQQIDSACQTEEERLLALVDTIEKTLAEQTTFENTVGALERGTTQYGSALYPIIFLKDVSPKKDVRASAEKCETRVRKFFVDLMVREKLYNALKAFKAKGQPISAVEAKLLDEYLMDFERNGLGLPPDQRKIFVEKKKELVTLEVEFSTTLNEWKDQIEVTREELAGLDDTFIAALKKTPEGKFILTVAYPHYYPIMKSASNPDVRRRLEIKFARKGGEKNKQRLEKAIQLRHQLAQMLGKATHADFVLERRMAKNATAVTTFLKDVAAKLKPLGLRDVNAFLELKREELHDPSISVIYSYDWRYYAEMVRKKKYDVDNQLIQEYFPLETVIKGMFDVYQTVLGVTFEEDSTGPRWHDSVKMYRVKNGGEVVALFYVDLFPREGKYQHAAAFDFSPAYLKADGTYQAPVSAIVANFPAPTAANPSLLPHADVETLFHEFGHIMHQILTRAKYAYFAGTNVKRDFVEAPSQMFENWVWKREPLEKMSSHYKTGKPLPDDLIEKMMGAKLATVGAEYLRQISFGLIDMTYHTSPSVDSTKVYHKITKDIMMVPVPKGTIPQAGFGHLMGGYDAGYYGYLWSEVYSADLFTRFETEGLLNTKTGSDLRTWILEPGGEKEPLELIKGFLGREPNDQAFLKSLGL